MCFADAKSVDLVVARDGFLSIQKSSVFFKAATLITEALFILLSNELNIADREGQQMLHFQTITGAPGTICIFYSGYFDYRRTYSS